MSARGMFGGTLALKGALDQQRQTHPHCQDGCVFCEDNARMVFEWWFMNYYPTRRASPRSR